MTKEIPLTRGKVALVDDEDYEELARYRWYCTASGYAVRDIWDRELKKRTCVYMHKEVLQFDGIVDHVNRNSLDNTRANLRHADNASNLRNRPRQVNNRSGFKGVSWSKVSQKWATEITRDGKKHYLGLFDDKEDAARMYNFWSADLHGEFAYLNKIDGVNWEAVQ